MKTQSLRLSAMNFLAIREHSVFELKSKLQKKFLDLDFPNDEYSDGNIDQLVLELLDDKLLSDERFAEVFIRSRMNKGFGPVKIEYELKSKGIAKHLIKLHMLSDEITWFDSIEKAWNKKFSRASASSDSDDKLKQSRYLYQRGFNFDQINNFLKTKDKNY